MRRCILILVCGIVLVSGVASGQLVNFCYWDDAIPPPEPPLTDANGDPLQDGTLVTIMHDLGNAGPDPADTAMAAFPCNGDIAGLGTGYFYSDPSFIAEIGTVVYLAISAEGRCWYTVNYQVPPGPQDRCFLWSEWSQTVPPCPWEPAQAAIEAVKPLSSALIEAYPNPFNSSTLIEFALASTTKVQAEIFNISGQMIFSLIDRWYPAGTHTLTWDAGAASNGVYLLRLHTNTEYRTQKLLLLR